MLSFLRTNQILNSLLLIFYIFLLWGSLFLVSHEWLPEPTGVFAQYTFDWLGTNNWSTRILAMLLLLFNATLLNFIIAEHRIEYETTLFPGLFYILVSCALPDFLHFSPILIGNMFLLFALFCLVRVYKNLRCADLIFNVGFWIGIASLFYFSFAFFVFWALMCLSVLRATKVKEMLMVITGFFVPYFLYGTYCFWLDQWDVFWVQQVSENLSFLDFRDKNDLTTYIKLGAFALLILLFLGSFGTYNFKKNIAIQKKITVFYWMLFFAGLSTLFQANVTLSHFQMIAIPASAFLAMTFSSMSKRWAESFHFIVLVLILALQFKSILI